MKSQKFLQFNGTNLYFINSEGKYFIAYKPICDALNIDASRCYKNLKKHKIFGPALANLPMQVESNGIVQFRNMTCIPEKYVYFWIATLNSDNENLIAFQYECAEILMNHFRGSIIERSDLLEEKLEIDFQIEKLEKNLLENDDFKTLNDLKKKKAGINKKLNKSDQKIIEEKINLFNYLQENN